MEKRTHQELIDAVRDILDEAQTPYFSDAQLIRALNQEYNDWFDEVARQAEHDEKKRRDLSVLIVPGKVVTVNSEGKVDLAPLDPKVFRILSVESSYSDCNQNRAVRPLSYDAWRTAERDPFNAPTVRFPAYLDGGGILELLPIPSGVSLTYLGRPRAIVESELSGKTEVEYGVQSRLIERAAKKLTIPLSDVGAYQVLSAEVAGQD